MLVKHAMDVPPEPMNKPGFSGMTARFVLTADDGCPNYALRLMEWTSGGETSFHRHKEEHEMFVLEGEATLINKAKEETRLLTGDAVYIAPCEYHQIRNTGTGRLWMICTIPLIPGKDGRITTPCD